ncbi:MAG: MOSC domain-containing protein [Candidatus Thiodiazotropha sp. DIVDIV]
MKNSSTIHDLLRHLPQKGSVEWIGVRPERGQTMTILESVMIDLNKGLVGDRYNGRTGGSRQVTLIQHEYFQVIAACLHRDSVLPEELRRNIVVSGINLLALKDKKFQIGEAVLKYSGQCHPCSKMELALGEGGYNAVRGHGGITASVIKSGEVRLHDKVIYLP